MRRIDFRIVLGSALMVLGGLMFLEKLNLLAGAGSLFWGAMLMTGGAAFLYVFFGDFRRQWWAVIPGLTLIGLGVESFLPEALQNLGGVIFLGALGLSFWLIYITNRAQWWAIIPGGVLWTLATVSSLDDVNGMETGGIFFMGLGLTFLLVAILPNSAGRMNWAYIPAAALILMGALLGNQATAGLTNYVWPAALILGGLLVIFGVMTRKE